MAIINTQWLAAPGRERERERERVRPKLHNFLDPRGLFSAIKEKSQTRTDLKSVVPSSVQEEYTQDRMLGFFII